MTRTLQPKEAKLALLSVDLIGFTRASAAVSAVDLARFLDAYYALCAGVVARHGGRIVKFMGDACFAVFDEPRCRDAVACALELRGAVGELRERPFDRGWSVGTNVHLAVVAEAELGPDRIARYDVVGEGVNYLFRMGSGAGVRISEPVYRALANEERGRWRKHRPPATYVLEDS